MRKLKLFMTALALTGGVNVALAQTDVTSTYIQNADFSQGTPVSSNVYGYAHDALKVSETTPYGLQDVTGWTAMPTGVTDGDAPAQGIENVAAMGAIFEYGSDYQMKGNSTTPPSTGPDGGAGTCLGIAAVWGANAQYYQDVTLPAGKYVFTVTYYSKSGTQNNTSLFGFIEDGGASHVVACNPATGEWKTASVTFTLLENTSGKISVGYKSTGNGSGANPHLYVDNIKLTKDDITAPTLPLRADFGGSSVDLNDFVVGNGDYTLEVQGTVGTPIVIAADNINYTPTTSGEVRFVKYDGVIYVYEDGFYITTAKSSKATASFTDITGANVTTSESNLLANPSFETLGSSVGSNIYNIGTPWTSNVTMKSGGIRVGTNSNATNGNYVLVWRGSGNNNYITQPLTTLKPLHQYQVKMQQVASGNANANFNVGIGSAEGEYTLSSTTVRLGTSNDGIKAITFDAPSNIVEGGTYYFTFRNTSNNTASSGNDPVTQIDWISLVCQNALAITGATSAVYLDGTAYAPTSAKEAYETLLSEAEETIAHTDYVNVTGSERTSLQAAIDVEVADNKEAYNAATLSLSAALDAFKDAKTAYDGYVTFVGGISVPNLAYASAEKKTAIDNAVAATPASASDVEAKESAITTALRAYYESHALAEKVDGAVDMTSAITNAANPSNTEGWTVNNTVGNSNMRTMNNEPWTNSDNTNPSSYFDSNSWGSAFSTTMKQDVTLEAGKYLLSVMARGNGITTYQLMAKEEATDIEAIGNTGGVFGRGWNNYTVEFEVTEDEAGATIGMNLITGNNGNWLSFGDFKLVQLSKTEVPMAGETEYAALNAAIEAAEAHTLGFDANEYAPYNNVEALEALAAAKEFDTSVENRKKLVTAATEALSSATWTKNTADVDAIFNGTFAETGTGNNPKGWTRNNNGWGQQITGLTAEANGVAEGTTTAWYYNNNGAWQYGNDGVYTMPLAASTKYVLKFKYSKHGGDTNNWMKASVLNENNEGLDVVQYPGASDNTMYQSASAYFTTGAAGNYILSIEQNGNVHLTDVSLVKTVSTEYALSEGATAAPSEMAYYETVALTRTLKGGSWNTFSVPFDAAIPEGWTVKEFTSAEENTLNFTAANSIVAGKPYLVKTSADVVNPTFQGVVVKATEGETVGTGDYQFAAQIYNKPFESYGTVAYLATDGTIKKLTSGGSIKGLRAYFIVPASETAAPARIAFVDEGGTTAIESVASETVNAENGIYDLQGRRVNAAKKGLYIINGKKVVK